MIKCKRADKYKALRPPKCGCEVCILKWNVAELGRVIKWLRVEPNFIMTVNEDMGATFQLVGAGLTWKAGDRFECYKMGKGNE